ncbi:MAG: substrate-binding domain-containing protein [Firmicutes bacterium]|nr:substrate-binding domain-containing protein [Bacillota bacterium]
MKHRLALLLTLLSVMVLVACLFVPYASASVKGKTVALTLLTRQHEFQLEMEAAIREVAEKAGMKFISVDSNMDPAKQFAQVEDFIEKKVDLIIIGPSDPRGLIPAVEEANRAGIPVITVDGTIEGGNIVTQVATDNLEGGRLAGELARKYIQQKLGGKANVVILDFPQSPVICGARVAGFESEIKKLPGVKIVAKQDGGAMRDRAMAVMDNILQGNPKIDVVFGINDDTILGAMAAAEGAGRIKEMVFIGYDGTKEACLFIKKGSQLIGDVAQQPKLIGTKAMEIGIKVLEGKAAGIPKSSPVPPVLITKENVDKFVK